MSRRHLQIQFCAACCSKTARYKHLFFDSLIIKQSIVRSANSDKHIQMKSCQSSTLELMKAKLQVIAQFSALFHLNILFPESHMEENSVHHP